MSQPTCAQDAKPLALIIEDDETYQCLMRDRLVNQGWRVRMAKRGAEGLAYLQQKIPDILILDLQLPDMSGVEVLEKAMQIAPEVIALIITGHASVTSSIEALRMGAEDYLPKPINLEHLDLVIARGMERRRLRQENEDLSFATGKTTGRYGLIGESPAMVAIYREIVRAARSQDTVLILGETGSGKEVAARAIHAKSDRAKKPFLAVNCSAISPTLLESELFGHVKGAFTGAQSDKPGYFKAAEGGTLLLDEIQSAPPAVQAALLRVLDRHEVVPVGGHEPYVINVRILVTCNKDLDALIADGAFREDLYYRILERSFALPPLRERPGDIPLLIQHFLGTIELPQGVSERRFSPKALSMLTNYSWPGNVRELRNTVVRIAQDAPRQMIRPADIPLTLRDRTSQDDQLPTLATLERQHIETVLARANGNKAEAAKRLGISRSSLYALLAKHEIS